jgi:Bacterial regulatory helix-turn-helix protein, lysR family
LLHTTSATTAATPPLPELDRRVERSSGTSAIRMADFSQKRSCPPRPSSNIPDLGSRQLPAVLAIADYGSFIAAAAFLKTSQPALTRTIKWIEDVLGVRLFERTGLIRLTQ